MKRLLLPVGLIVLSPMLLVGTLLLASIQVRDGNLYETAFGSVLGLFVTLLYTLVTISVLAGIILLIIRLTTLSSANITQPVTNGDPSPAEKSILRKQNKHKTLQLWILILWPIILAPLIVLRQIYILNNVDTIAGQSSNSQTRQQTGCMQYIKPPEPGDVGYDAYMRCNSDNMSNESKSTTSMSARDIKDESNLTIFLTIMLALPTWLVSTFIGLHLYRNSR